ncbi:TetR/AcrR family transcriptional regulator [Spongiactinospora sp. TRM90649]|uniref:TetR/AcrR family transcriptional regulator n=1 Tax=Spongiactinospora sp. TRM90649 TaxID=3031114 RepID=UPI0023F7011D|nr:TetR/AcrR family transcriptional regulator [Spongiactinospora sp. TRM90649]MDF5757193.1 TetR/AcrR family transcriptional regulator [Spongiactinospora sp. TRM90649]
MARSGSSDTKARIQQVARELFARQGVQQTSLRQIAERLGITKPALYYHFASREDLLNSIIQPLVDDVEAFLAEREPAGRQEPRRLLEDYFDLMYRNREISTMVVRELTALAYLDLGTRLLDWRRRVNALLVGPQPDLESEVRAVAAVGGLVDCTVAFPDVPADRLRPIAVGTACAALGID